MWPRLKKRNKGWCSACKLAAIGAIILGPEATNRGRFTRTCRESKRVREQESIWYWKSPLSEAEIRRMELGEKYPYHTLPLCTSLWTPGGAPVCEMKQMPMSKEAPHRSPFQGPGQSGEGERVDLEGHVEDAKHTDFREVLRWCWSCPSTSLLASSV